MEAVFDPDKLYQAVRSGDWVIVAALATIGLVYLARRFLGDLVPWIRSDRGGVLLAFATALLGAVATSAIVCHCWPDLKALVAAFVTALTAMGGWSGAKKLILGK